MPDQSRADQINPRAVPGNNQAPDYAKIVAERLTADYALVIAEVSNVEAEAQAQPETVNDDATALTIGGVIKRIRDLSARIENIRVTENEPYLRSTNAVNSLFFGLRDRLAKRDPRDRKAQNGVADILQARINAYQDAKIAEERARLERERIQREREAREAEDRARRERADAEAKRLAAERARAPAQVEQKTAAADDATVAASIADQEAETKRQQAEDARIAALAKPSDLARVRGNDAAGAGVTLTVKQEPYSMVTDRSLLDMNKLRPFFTDAELEKALRGWAKTTGHREKMEGAEIGFRNAGVTR